VAMTLGRIISALLICEAFGASLVRKTDVAVSANGEIEEIQSLMEKYAGEDSEELLTRVQALFENNKELDENDADSINVIKDLVDKELLPALQKTHDSAQDQVKKNLAAVEKCSAQSKARQASVKSSTEAATDKARQLHATCRAEEQKKEGTKNGKCEQLDTYLSAVQVPEQIPSGRPRDQMVKYVDTMSSYFCPKGPKVKELAAACKEAEDEHAKHQADCNKKQAVFELDFCTWRTSLSDACGELDTCHADAVEAWKTHSDATKPLVVKWKIEFKSLHKIKCYTDVWLKDKNIKTVDSSHYEKCKGTEADDSKMDIDYGTPAAKTPCDLSPVATHPGTAKFPSVEYAKFSKYATSPIPCVGTSAAAAPEAAPTPTCKPVSTATADAGYSDSYRGWYDVQGCGKCNDYCRWVGNTGSGGDPSKKLHVPGGNNPSWWSCRLAGENQNYSPRSHFKSFPYKKCSGKGAQAP